MIRALLLALIPSVAQASCSDVIYDNRSFTVCEASLDDNLRMWLRSEDGEILGNFSALTEELGPDQRLLWAMNAGMYHADRSPVGYYVEDEAQITALQDGGGYGNFGMVPNGVFCVSDRGYEVIETQAFRATLPHCDFATQSGPMLVIDGELHPRFNESSTSFNYRNGVGVSADGTRAVFAISNSAVNFYTFATFFRDHLNTPNALFLDGKVSRLFSDDLNRYDGGFPIGPIVGVVE